MQVEVGNGRQIQLDVGRGGRMQVELGMMQVEIELDRLFPAEKDGFPSIYCHQEHLLGSLEMHVDLY